jgi:hypothetical protein
VISSHITEKPNMECKVNRGPELLAVVGRPLFSIAIRLKLLLDLKDRIYSIECF